MKSLYLYLTVAIILVVGGCKKSEVDTLPLYTLIDVPLEARYNTVKEIKIGDSKGNLIPNSQFVWSSDNDKIGTVIDGVFRGRKIGELKVKAVPASGRPVEFTIEVKPNYTLYAEPALLFGSGKDQIKASEKRTLVDESDAALAYKGENDKVDLVGYVFENGKLVSSGVHLPPKAGIATQIEVFLKERYPDNGMVNGQRVFLDDNRKYGSFLIGSQDKGYSVVYTEYK